MLLQIFTTWAAFHCIRRMPSLKITVKWGRELFQGINVDTDAKPACFRQQLFDLTGVRPERQKIMFKGNILKDAEWNLDLKEGSTVLLLGTKDVVPETPSKPARFIEDMDTDMATALEIDLPAGFKNLGNTCYLNATLQCLKSIPELRVALSQFKLEDPLRSSVPVAFTGSLKVLFKQMDDFKTVIPAILFSSLHTSCPQFSQIAQDGTYRQQDANECWLELLKLLQPLPPTTSVNGAIQGKQYKSFVDQYLGGVFEVKMQCTECDEQEATCTTEPFLQLSCFISSEVKDMRTGLKLRLKEQLTKHSETLGRDASFNRIYGINRLPAYLTVQFVRFQYKGKGGINAKILKDIKFPLEFDAYELCTPELQKKLCPMRSKFEQMRDKDVPKDGDSTSVGQDPKANYWFEDDVGSNNSGFYSLQAVLTHKGRSSSSGHYVAWIKDEKNEWFKLDDDTVSSVTSDDILRLSGGGDWHCAYVLLYGPKLLYGQ